MTSSSTSVNVGDIDVAGNLAATHSRIALALPAPDTQIRIVAVGKTKPSELLLRAYEAGHRHFGENYVQELSSKVAELPEDCIWHFIGHLQSNKSRTLLQAVFGKNGEFLGRRHLVMETVDTEKLAGILDKEMGLLKEAESGGETDHQ